MTIQIDDRTGEPMRFVGRFYSFRAPGGFAAYQRASGRVATMRMQHVREPTPSERRAATDIFRAVSLVNRRLTYHPQ